MRPLWERMRRDDSGFTLAELAVGMILFGVLSSVLSTTVLGSSKTSETARQVNNLNEEARIALNRVSRELRQASAITAVAGTDGAAGLTFDVDFNGNGVIDASTADPERLTYKWDGERILLSAADTAGTTVTQPILSGEVSAFRVEYRSSRYEFDCNADGVTTWQELDSGSCRPVGTTVGNANAILDTAELSEIDSIVLAFSVLDGARRQDYRTQIDLRNAQ